MTITRAAAREITTATEQQLVDDSFHPKVRELSEAELRRAITRARRTRDKYTDLERRQGLDTKRRGRSGSGANARTARKVRLFAETLERLEKRLATLADSYRSLGASVEAPRFGVDAWWRRGGWNFLSAPVAPAAPRSLI